MTPGMMNPRRPLNAYRRSPAIEMISEMTLMAIAA